MKFIVYFINARLNGEYLMVMAINGNVRQKYLMPVSIYFLANSFRFLLFVSARIKYKKVNLIFVILIQSSKLIAMERYVPVRWSKLQICAFFLRYYNNTSGKKYDPGHFTTYRYDVQARNLEFLRIRRTTYRMSWQEKDSSLLCLFWYKYIPRRRIQWFFRCSRQRKWWESSCSQRLSDTRW